MNKSIFEDPLEAEGSLYETRLSCALVFHVSLREFEEIKRQLRAYRDRIVYQKISSDPLWIVPKREAHR